jgi:hypothetical protein
MDKSQKQDKEELLPSLKPALLHGLHPQLEALVRRLARKAARALCKKEQSQKE